MTCGKRWRKPIRLVVSWNDVGSWLVVAGGIAIREIGGPGGRVTTQGRPGDWVGFRETTRGGL